jgi:tetratricopeptide (TPR) repeat protein
LLIHDEINQLKWANDLKDNDERKLYQIRAKGLEYYRNNKFGKAIEQFSQIENLDIKNNRFKTLIKECLIDLGICYLATGQNDAACKTFEKIGDKTDFEIRNYILDFCEKK